jgi:hypothetical protein
MAENKRALTLNSYLYAPPSVQEKIASGVVMDLEKRVAEIKKHLGALKNIIDAEKTIG